MFEKVIKEIEKYDSIIIHRHKNPDGDAVGSQVGLKNIIKDKRVCWVDLLVQKDNISYDRFNSQGVTISELKMYSHYYLKNI